MDQLGFGMIRVDRGDGFHFGTVHDDRIALHMRAAIRVADGNGFEDLYRTVSRDGS